MLFQLPQIMPTVMKKITKRSQASFFLDYLLSLHNSFKPLLLFSLPFASSFVNMTSGNGMRKGHSCTWEGGSL